MQMNQKELQKIMQSDFDEDFDLEAYTGFQKIQKTSKSFDDGVSKKKNFNPKKSKAFSQQKSH